MLWYLVAGCLVALVVIALVFTRRRANRLEQQSSSGATPPKAGPRAEVHPVTDYEAEADSRRAYRLPFGR